jgi:hypothetical protein
MLEHLAAACTIASTGLRLYATLRPAARHTGRMTDRLLPGLATDEELAAGRRVVRCGMCGRPLTGQQARMRGLGRFEVEQDGLPGV